MFVKTVYHIQYRMLYFVVVPVVVVVVRGGWGV